MTRNRDPRRRRRGYTLVELSLAMAIGMMVAIMVLALVNQQLAFSRIFRSQDFLVEEAPVINNYIGRLIGRAERFRFHASVGDALSGASPMTEGARVLVLNFRQPDGTMQAAILSFETRDGEPGLYYYAVPVGGVVENPNWAVSRKLSDVQFSMDQGVLRILLTGPAGEQITYSGVAQT